MPRLGSDSPQVRARMNGTTDLPMWCAVQLTMWPLAARQCLVRNPVNGAAARLDADEYALLSSCEGAKPLAQHEADIVARFNPPAAHRAAIRQFLQRCCELRLLVGVDELVASCDAGLPAPTAPCSVVVRTADRPQLLGRLLDDAVELERRTQHARAWHVLDDSRDGDSRRRNRDVVAQRTLDCTVHDLDGVHAMHGELCAAFPDLRPEIDSLLGAPEDGAASYGRPINHALLRFAGERWLAIDDDALLRPRGCPKPLPGFEASSANDELFAYATQHELLDACPAVTLDPFEQHERWLGESLGRAWHAATREHGAPSVTLTVEDALRFASDARIVFTQNAAVGDPGSSLFPYHVLSLSPASLAHVIADPARQASAFTHRHDWRGVRRFRLAPRRLLTFTTVAGIDNRSLLPPTVRTQRNEDLLLGSVAQLAYPQAWFADLPFGLQHERAAAKQWLAPDASFAQEPVHWLLDTLEEHAVRISAQHPDDRLVALSAVLCDVAKSGERELEQRLEAHALDTATRVLFSIQTQLDDASVPGAWKDRLRPWLASPALAVHGSALRARLASTAVARELCREYGAALAVWPTLWNHCRRMAA